MSKSKFFQVPFEGLVCYLYRLGGHHPQHGSSFLQSVLNRYKFTSPSGLLFLLSDSAGSGGPFTLTSSLNHQSSTGIPLFHLFPHKWDRPCHPCRFPDTVTVGTGFGKNKESRCFAWRNFVTSMTERRRYTFRTGR